MHSFHSDCGWILGKALLAMVVITVESFPQERESETQPASGSSVFRLQVSTGFPEYFALGGALRLAERLYAGAKVHMTVLGQRDPGKNWLFQVASLGGPFESGTGFGPTVTYFVDPDSSAILTNILFEATLTTPSSFSPSGNKKGGGTFQLLLCHDDLAAGAVTLAYGLGMVLLTRPELNPSLTPSIRLGVHFNI